MSSSRSTRSVDLALSVGGRGRVGRRHDAEEHRLALLERRRQLVVRRGAQDVEVHRDAARAGAA